mmetsp:Transcript_2408/g.6404  ORF Transcript_2408/g.6404 Transcript_2408/m.6404 type:complete len:195 (-) Transcript_2408:4-588(-)
MAKVAPYPASTGSSGDAHAHGHHPHSAGRNRTHKPAASNLHAALLGANANANVSNHVNNHRPVTPPQTISHQHINLSYSASATPAAMASSSSSSSELSLALDNNDDDHGNHDNLRRAPARSALHSALHPNPTSTGTLHTILSGGNSSNTGTPTNSMLSPAGTAAGGRAVDAVTLTPPPTITATPAPTPSSKPSS